MKCYLCKGETKLLFHKGGYSVLRCTVCGLEMTDLRQNYDEFLIAHYSKGYFTGDPAKRAYADYQNDKSNIVRNMKKILSFIKTLKPTGRVLDVGAALGYFVELALSAGYDAYGFDTSSYAASAGQNLVGKTRIKHASVHTVDYPKNFFDVITLFDVFEHLKDPKRDLNKLHNLLKDDGILVIATGDSKSFMARIAGRRWTFYNPPQHLFFFNRSTLSLLFSSVGLIPTTWFRVGKWLSLSYILHLAATCSESNLAKRLLSLISGTPIRGLSFYLPLGDNMVVIARKQ